MAKKNKQRATNAAPAGDQTRYWFEKLPRLVSQGRFDDVLSALERFWPASRPKERLSVLIRVWPARVAVELPETVSDALVESLVPATLTFDDAAFEALATARPMAPWVAELRALRVAQEHLCAGQVPMAREVLQAVGARSPLRSGRLWLRALCSLQEGVDDDARRALDALADSPLSGVAARVRAALDGGAPDVARTLGLGSAAPGLDEAVRLLADRRPNEGLAALARSAALLDRTVLRALRRTLPWTLQSSGVDIKAIPQRLEKALRADPEDPADARLRALLHGRAGCPCCAADRWLDARDALARAALPAGLDRRKVEAALLTRAAEGLIGPGDPSDQDFFPPRHYGLLDDLHEARELLEKAITLDPGRRQAWDLQFKALKVLRDRSALTEFTEDYAAAFPEDIDVQLAAAASCSARRSFLKAAAHARRAAQLAPHDPRVRDLEAQILIGRAHKQADSDRVTQGRETVMVACAIQSLSDPVRCHARATAAAFEVAAGTTSNRNALRRHELETGTTPWEWETRELIALNMLGVRRPGLGRPASERDSWAPPPEGVISRMLDLINEEAGEGRLLIDLIDVARRLAAFGDRLTKERDLRMAIHWAGDDETRLGILEHACATHPDAPEFHLQRCDLAMKLGRPAAYLADAEGELQRLLDEYTHIHDPEDDEHEGWEDEGWEDEDWDDEDEPWELSGSSNGRSRPRGLAEDLADAISRITAYRTGKPKQAPAR